VDPHCFILAAAALVINTVITDPIGSLKGIAVVLTGAPVFLIWSRRTKSKAEIEYKAR
jgi:APA family basic amino acid/polyamine antiporter